MRSVHTVGGSTTCESDEISFKSFIQFLVNFKYNDPELFETGDLDRFQSFTASLAYTFKMNEVWRFGTQTGIKIASNFSQK